MMFIVHRGFMIQTFENVKSYLEDFDFVQVIKNRIQDCEELFEGKSIHFVHLDVDLYHPMLFSLNMFLKKIAARWNYTC